MFSPACSFLYFATCILQQRERFLRHSDTGPVGDWPSPLESSTSPGSRSVKDGNGCARPRAWSVRTFQDFLPPLPQLHKKWCSWNSTSPFTKLVDSVSTTIITYKIKRSYLNGQILPTDYVKYDLDELTLEECS